MSNIKYNSWTIPILLFAVVHLVILGSTYGTITNEMKNFNVSLSAVVSELKKTSAMMYSLKEGEVRMKLHQEFILTRLIELEKR